MRAPGIPDKAAALERWLRQVEAAFDGRVLGIDNAVSDQWGRMSAIRPIPVIDGLLAATAVTHGLTLVTRNDRDVAGLGAIVLNPFRTAKITVVRKLGGSRMTDRAIAMGHGENQQGAPENGALDRPAHQSLNGSNSPSPAIATANGRSICKNLTDPE